MLLPMFMLGFWPVLYADDVNINFLLLINCLILD